MVHYDPQLAVTQAPPPICPRCGSHRTEIVGRSQDGLTLTLRCNVCGVHSSVKVPEEVAAPRQ